MKLKILIYFSLISLSFSLLISDHISENQNIQNTANAVNQIIHEFYIRSQSKFDILFMKNSISSFELLEHILMQNKLKYYTSINLFNNFIPDFIYLKHSAVTFLYSCEDFFSIHSAVRFKNSMPKALKFLTYIENCGLKNLQKNLIYLIRQPKLDFGYSFLEVFEFLIINDRKFIYLILHVLRTKY